MKNVAIQIGWTLDCKSSNLLLNHFYKFLYSQLQGEKNQKIVLFANTSVHQTICVFETLSQSSPPGFKPYHHKRNQFRLMEFWDATAFIETVHLFHKKWYHMINHIVEIII